MLTYRRTLAASTLAVSVLLTAACSPGTDTPGDVGGRPAARGTALAALDTLTVKGRAPKTGYEREKFGRALADVDGNGCGTRVISMLRRVAGTFAQLMQGMVSCAY
ncbi:hypothetical protein ACFVIY_14550 [Streptomyces sp. NPDC127166]|uniref:hypothetical protein n=1 Tax=Streptomyces sp. NPDC127166 TaxID=3345380 RepID=UPI003642C5E5